MSGTPKKPRGASFGPGYHPDRFRTTRREFTEAERGMLYSWHAHGDPVTGPTEVEVCGTWQPYSGAYGDALRCATCGMFYDPARTASTAVTVRDGQEYRFTRQLPATAKPKPEPRPAPPAPPATPTEVPPMTTPENWDAVTYTPASADAATPDAVLDTLRDLLRAGEKPLTPEQVRGIAADVMRQGAQAGAFRQVIRIERHDAPAVELSGLAHQQLASIIQTASYQRRNGSRFNILLVGPKGCGKSYLAKQLAEALQLPYGAMSCSIGTSDGEIIGRVIPNITGGTAALQESLFLRFYQHGGVFLGDELDALNPAVALRLNMALEGAECFDGLGRLITKHRDFIFVGTMNTWGNGANREYCAREMQDSALLDRFSGGEFDFDYDHALEAAVCPDKALLKLLHGMREKAAKNKMPKRVVSTRRIAACYELVAGMGLSHRDALHRITAGWPDADRTLLGVPA